MANQYLGNEDYEVSYQKALLVLAEKYDSVGEPYNRDGQRICRVESLAADDRTVFLLAWGIKVADEIEYRLRYHHYVPNLDRSAV